MDSTKIINVSIFFFWKKLRLWTGSNRFTKQRWVLHFQENHFATIWISERMISLDFLLKSFLCKWVTSCDIGTTLFLINMTLDEKDSLFRGHISAKSQPILKNYMRFGIAKEFPTIWDFARLCSFIRLEVVIKNKIFVLSSNQRDLFLRHFWR